jgi:hypothetical protein
MAPSRVNALFGLFIVFAILWVKHSNNKATSVLSLNWRGSCRLHGGSICHQWLSGGSWTLPPLSNSAAKVRTFPDMAMKKMRIPAFSIVTQ